jgi:hypothetical protein
MAGEPQQNGQDGMTPARLADMLSQAGGMEVAPMDIESDVQAGAPVLSNGSIPLVRYIRWLHTQVVNGVV